MISTAPLARFLASGTGHSTGINEPEPLAAARAALCAIASRDAGIKAWEFVAHANSLPVPEFRQGALAGLPFGVKDMIDVADMPTSCGSVACAGTVANFDASCVALLRAAGAVPVGKTVTTEFAYVTSGPTRNPVDLRYTPGGSSSGSAAAVAAGMVPVALGTQTGGSMIRPAAFCGVVGFKPTFGAVDRDGLNVTCESLDVIGWYGDSVQRVADIGRVLLPYPHAPGKRPLQELRIAFLHGNPGHVLGAEAEAALASAGRALSKKGMIIKPVPTFEPAFQLLEAYSVIMHYEYARSLLPVVAAAAHVLSRPLLNAVERGMALSAADYSAMRVFQETQRLHWETYFGDADLILTSSALGVAPEGIQHTGNSAFNKGWSLLGWPCLHLPTTFSAKGLPLGVLLVGRPGADAELLACGEAIHLLVDERPLYRTTR